MIRGAVLAQAGGLFAAFAFVHFAVDWIFQTHAEAMAKHNNAGVRARHCAIYTVGFLPLLWWLGWEPWRLGVGAAVLFFSHFAEDTYWPVYVWARYVRRVPIVRTYQDQQGFVMWVDGTLGKILMIAVDQIVHLAFLWALVGLEMWR
jgi:hypothetical protein